MRIGSDNYSEPEEIGRESRQGCPLCPLLIDFYIAELIREVLEEEKAGINIGGSDTSYTPCRRSDDADRDRVKESYKE